MAVFVLILLFNISFGMTQSMESLDLTGNYTKIYYDHVECPRTNWCLELNSLAQLIGYGWQNFPFPDNFSITFWYKISIEQESSLSSSSITYYNNIMSNCHSSGLISNVSSFLFESLTQSSAIKTSYFNVYFNNSKECNSMNNTKCSASFMELNNEWQFISIIYNLKYGVNIYSNLSEWNTSSLIKGKLKSSLNILCIGNGDNNKENNANMFLTDIRFYNYSINKTIMNHLYDLNYNLTKSDNNGIFAYYDFINSTTTNNINNLCTNIYYVNSIYPSSLSITSSSSMTIYLYGNFDTKNKDLTIQLFDKNDGFKLIISDSNINIINSSTLSFYISSSNSINKICTNRLYINIYNNLKNKCLINNYDNISLSLYSSLITATPNQIPAISSNITVNGQCFPPNDPSIECILYLNNNNKQNIKAIYIKNNELLCKFTDLSSLSASSNYSLWIFSTKYGYSTQRFEPITIYSKPILTKLSNTIFNDNEQQSQLKIYGDNLLQLQPFQCNIIDSTIKSSQKLVFQTKAQNNGNNSVSCIINTVNLPNYKPSNKYNFYLSSSLYFNSTKFGIKITNSKPNLGNSIFIYGNNNNNNNKLAIPSGSFQYFETQLVDDALHNFTSIPNNYLFNMSSINCSSIIFIQNEIINKGIINWSYYAPPPLSLNNTFSCLINFTSFYYDEEIQKISLSSTKLFTISFMTYNPNIISINNTLFAQNNITEFYFKTSNLYLNEKYFYYKNNNIIYQNNIKLLCQFINVNNKDIFEFDAILISNDVKNNIQSLKCPNIILSQCPDQYIFKFKIEQFDKQNYSTMPYNNSNQEILFCYQIPIFQNINFLNQSKHIYLYGDNFQIGINNKLAVNEWLLLCLFGTDIKSNGYVINNTLIFCEYPQTINQHSIDNTLPISIIYIEYKDQYKHIYNNFNQILISTNLSISFVTSCINNCNNNGYCDEIGSCHCNNGYSGNDCSFPLYLILFTVIISMFIIIIIILLYFIRFYRNKYRKLQNLLNNNNNINNRRSKGGGYKPIETNEEDECCCFNLSNGHFGYYICCQFCCCCDVPSTSITKIQLPIEEDSNTYTSTFHVPPNHQQQHQQHQQQIVFNKSNQNLLYDDEDDDDLSVND